MDDREKVIKGLECCILGNKHEPDCDICPYSASCNDTCDTMDELFSDALALLKAHEPVKPVPGLWDRDIPLFNCGACGKGIGAEGISKYCFHCGRAVKWE